MIRRDGWLFTAARAAVHEASATAVVSDLHLGYAEARRRAGEAVPAEAIDRLLAPLRDAIEQLSIRELVIAGDLFEAGPNPGVTEQLRRWVAATPLRQVVLVAGNHDRGLRGLPAEFVVATGPVVVGGWQVVHGDRDLPSGPVVQGHLHPGLRATPGRPCVPCFLVRAGHVVLPAYSPDAAGVDARRSARWQGYRCLAIAGDGVIDVGEIDAVKTKRGAGGRRRPFRA
jgi:metallophosphoesterase superfamily enzyme